MSRLLAELLGVPVTGFHLNVQQLEQASGNPAVDIRLASEIQQRSRDKIRQLGLDPDDTTPSELYEVLKNRIRDDDIRLQSILQQRIGKGKISQAIVKSIQSLPIPKSCFAIKHSAAKRILKKNPPKLTMRRLGYRSLDSLLKREPAAVIFTVSNMIESEAWSQRLLDEFKNLVPGDFEVREIETFHPVRTKHWEEITSMIAKQQHSSVFVCKELGGVIIMPLPEEVPTGTLTTLILALQAVNDIRIHSAFCKLQQVKQNFGSIIAESLKGTVDALAVMAGQPVPWKVIQTYYSQHSDDFPGQLFEPHVQKEDLQMARIEKTLIGIDSSLDFWDNTACAASDQLGEVVSLNIKDVAISSVNALPFESRLLGGFRESLWVELMVHYLQEKHLEEKVLKQLDSQLVEDAGEGSFELNLAEA
jgi:hypothetical protein